MWIRKELGIINQLDPDDCLICGRPTLVRSVVNGVEKKKRLDYMTFRNGI